MQKILIPLIVGGLSMAVVGIMLKGSHTGYMVLGLSGAAVGGLVIGNIVDGMLND